jgi:hypothetical protein
MHLQIIKHCFMFQAHGGGSLPVCVEMPRGTGSIASHTNTEEKQAELALGGGARQLHLLLLRAHEEAKIAALARKY